MTDTGMPAGTWALLVTFVIAGPASALLGYWPHQIFFFGSLVAVVIAAIRMKEYWPAVEPTLSFFLFYPLAFFALRIVTGPVLGLTAAPVLDWAGWTVSGTALGVIITAALTLAYRRHIDREWAVVRTLAAAIAYSLALLEVLNIQLPQPPPHVEWVHVDDLTPGGYRASGPRVTLAPAPPYYVGSSTHSVPWRVFNAADRGVAPMCLFVYRGALWSRWVHVDCCPDGKPPES